MLTSLKRTSCLSPSIKSELHTSSHSGLCFVFMFFVRHDHAAPSSVFRAHWYLVVICFPGLDEPTSETWSGPDGKLLDPEAAWGSESPKDATETPPPPVHGDCVNMETGGCDPLSRPTRLNDASSCAPVVHVVVPMFKLGSCVFRKASRRPD